MSATIRLHTLPPSPNNAKVRIALGYKGIPYEEVQVPFSGFPVSPEDRAGVVALSTQPLTPTIEHEGRVVFDSGAILRYLDANFPDTPRLFSSEYATMQEIEDWEGWIRYGTRGVLGPVLLQALQIEPFDAGKLAESSRLVHEHAARVEERLAQGSWLVGEVLSAADVTAAPFFALAAASEAHAAQNPLMAFFREHFQLGEGRDRTRDWIGRVMVHDRQPAGIS